MDRIESLEQTFDYTRGVIAGVGPEQYDQPTPCAEWKVRDLLGHVVGVVSGMGAAARGQAPAPVELGDDPAAQFDRAASDTLAAWRAPGVMDRTIDGGAGPMPGSVLSGINLLDTATHAWDLAKATGQPATLPPGVAEAALEASRAIISPEVRGGRFGPEVSVGADAGPTDRLVAFLGRQP